MERLLRLWRVVRHAQQITLDWGGFLARRVSLRGAFAKQDWMRCIHLLLQDFGPLLAHLLAFNVHWGLVEVGAFIDDDERRSVAANFGGGP